ncbi:MAG TPA: PP2C family serine/threonine-protein phosphatase [Allosphingosinicella sp.]
MPPRIFITASTHPGLGRDGHNEDAICAGKWFANRTLWAPWRAQLSLDRPILCAIADGMGGHAAGEVASEAVLRSLSARAGRMAEPLEIERAVDDADRALRDRMAAAPELGGMGTTLVGMLLAPDGLLWFNIGDSRLYRVRDGFLRQLSTDDVPPSPEDDGGRRRTSVLIASLGGPPLQERLDPHVGMERPLLAPSRWLLCSDGVTDMLDRSAMETALQGNDLEAWVSLFGQVMDAGAEDNFSIMLISIEADSDEELEDRDGR